MMGRSEASIIINGNPLTVAQSLTLRVAVGSMLSYLDDAETIEDLGEIGPLYRARLGEIQRMIFQSMLGE